MPQALWTKPTVSGSRAHFLLRTKDRKWSFKEGKEFASSPLCGLWILCVSGTSGPPNAGRQSKSEGPGLIIDSCWPRRGPQWQPPGVSGVELRASQEALAALRAGLIAGLWKGACSTLNAFEEVLMKKEGSPPDLSFHIMDFMRAEIMGVKVSTWTPLCSDVASPGQW